MAYTPRSRSSMAIPLGTTLTIVPRLTAHATSANVRSLPLSPTDGFVLSRIDGVSSGRDLSAATGLDANDVLESIVKLAELGVVEYPGSPRPRPPMVTRSPSVEMNATPQHYAQPPPLPTAPPAPPSRSSLPPRASMVPPRFDNEVKRTISGQYTQVAPDRPSSRPHVATTSSSKPPAASPSHPPPNTERTPHDPHGVMSHRPVAQSWSPMGTGVPSRLDTPTSVMAQPNQPPAPPSKPAPQRIPSPMPPPPPRSNAGRHMSVTTPQPGSISPSPSSQPQSQPHPQSQPQAYASQSAPPNQTVARTMSRSPPMIVPRSGASVPPSTQHASTPPQQAHVSTPPQPRLSGAPGQPSSGQPSSPPPQRSVPIGQISTARSAPPPPMPSTAPNAAPSAPSSSPQGATQAVGQVGQGHQSAVTIGPGHSAPSTTSTAVSDDIDLDLEQRNKVEELFAQIDVLDYYAILGVPRGADKKAVKRAYYELAANFHPDKFFRKSLGAYKAKMEAIFGRLTVAHDTLTSKTERAEYDAYLGVRAQVHEHEAILAGAHDEIRKAEEDIQRAARHAVPVSVAPPPIVEAPRAPSVPPVTAFTPSKSFDVQAAREALARKLRGGQAMPSRPAATVGSSSPASPMSQPPPPLQPANPLSARDAVDALKRRYEERMVDSRAAQVAKYKTAGETAIAKGDYVAGVNALRVALSFDPENADLAAQTEEAQRNADTLLAENYEKQALYEEKNDQWAHAARSWARVARARPTSAVAQERAANSILRSQGNVREGAEFAKRAVGLEPKNGHYHATLAWAYLVGGMLLNAKREIEMAVQMAPEDPTVVSIAKRIKDAS